MKKTIKKIFGLAALISTISSCQEYTLYHIPSDDDEQQPTPTPSESVPSALECRVENCSQNFTISGVSGRISQRIVQVVREGEEREYTLELVCLGANYYHQRLPDSPAPYGPYTNANQKCYLINEYTSETLENEHPEMEQWFFGGESAVFAPLQSCLPLADKEQFMLLSADIPYFDGTRTGPYEGEIEFCVIPHN